jgi:D-alanyl-D-alanine carboxypeptidase
MPARPVRPVRPVRPPRTLRRPRPATLLVIAATSLALLVPVTADAYADTAADTAESANDRALQRQIEQFVSEPGGPPAVIAVLRKGKQTRVLRAGAADLATGRPPRADDHMRIASTAKAFSGAVALSLVDRGALRLDDTLRKRLPQLPAAWGRVTLRQLLQHTSGLPDYVAAMGGDFFKGRHTYTEPRDLLDLALTEKAKFAPGSKFEYSNTNYLLAGLLIQKVTGRPVAEEITQRVIKPTGLRHTYFPGIGDQDIRRPHPRGYHVPKPGDAMRDITEMDPSWAWAAGQMVATPSDLNRFYSALLGGKLLKPAQLKQMRTTVPASDLWPGARYGLGLISTPLSCGGLVWGHGGDIPGYETRGGATEDGRAVSVTVTALPSALPTGQAGQQTAADHVIDFVDTALCE